MMPSNIKKFFLISLFILSLFSFASPVSAGCWAWANVVAGYVTDCETGGQLQHITLKDGSSQYRNMVRGNIGGGQVYQPILYSTGGGYWIFYNMFGYGSCGQTVDLWADGYVSKTGIPANPPTSQGMQINRCLNPKHLTGTITDCETGQALSGVMIKNKRTYDSRLQYGSYGYSDVNGNYDLPAIFDQAPARSDINCTFQRSAYKTLETGCAIPSSDASRTMNVCLEPLPKTYLEVCTTDCATGNPLPAYKVVDTLTGEVTVIDSLSTLQGVLPSLQSGDSVLIPGYSLMIDGSNVLFGDSDGCRKREVVTGTGAHSIFATYAGYDQFIESSQLIIDPGETYTKHICLNKLYVDCGLRVKEESGTVTPACEPTGTVTSPLRVFNGSDTYGVVLVDPSDSAASNVRIQTSSGVKAIQKI